MNSRASGRILALVIVAVAVALAFGTVLGNDASDRVFPLPVNEEDKTYLPADEAEKQYNAAIDSMLEELRSTSDVDDMATAIYDGYEALVDTINQYVWMNLDYSIHPAEYAEEYQKWSLINDTALNTYRSALREVLISDTTGRMEKALDSVGIDPADIRDEEPLTPEEKALLDRQTQLVTEYDDIMSREYSRTVNGITVTSSNYSSVGNLTLQQRTEAYYGLLYDRWYDAAEVYAQLVDVRNEYATIQGYSDYAEYSYGNIYSRDYGPDDAWTFTECTGEVYERYAELGDMISSDPTLSYSNLNWLRSLDHDGALNLLRAHESNVGGDLPDLVDYMKRYDLFYICENSDSLNSAYTIQIFNQNSALIFLGAPYTGIPLVTTLVHEFGHASYICLNSNSQTCLDVMEIQSQGNEALFYAACGGYLMRGSDSMAANGISDLMYTVWTAGLWTQFELWAYEKQAETGETLTVQMLSDGFDAILEKNGMTDTFQFPPGLRGLAWVQVPHLFQSPLYYVSYATSALNALEIYEIAVDDFDKARDLYLDVVYLKDIDGYVDTVKRTGLTNALEKGAATDIVDKALEALKRQVAST